MFLLTYSECFFDIFADLIKTLFEKYLCYGLRGLIFAVYCDRHFVAPGFCILNFDYQSQYSLKIGWVVGQDPLAHDLYVPLSIVDPLDQRPIESLCLWFKVLSLKLCFVINCSCNILYQKCCKDARICSLQFYDIEMSHKFDFTISPENQVLDPWDLPTCVGQILCKIIFAASNYGEMHCKKFGKCIKFGYGLVYELVLILFLLKKQYL